jgi:signal transduction histidine kinase
MARRLFRVGGTGRRRAVSRFLRMQLSRRLTAYSVLILVVLHGANAILIAKLVESAETIAAEAMRARATLLAEHASRSIGGIDLALEEIASKEAADPDLGRKSVPLHMLLHDTAARLPQVKAIVIDDLNGVMIQDSRRYPAKRFSYANYPAFSEQKKWRGVGLYISAPTLSQVDGQAYFVVSRPILASDGDLRGVVVMVADPTYFMSFYGQNAGIGMAALAKDDGAVLAAVVPPERRQALIGMDVQRFLNLNPGFMSVVQPVSGLPLKIVVTTPPVWMQPFFRTYAEADLLFMAMITLLVALGTVKLAREANARERAAEAERVARERAEAADRAKSAFLATMSHELRTPLNAVIGFAELIDQEAFGPVAARYKEYGGLIVKSGRHLLKIINDILDLAKLQSGKTELMLEPVDPALSIHEAATLLANRAAEKGVLLQHEPDAKLPSIAADSTRLHQVLINLISNAIKFTPSGGTVAVRAWRASAGVVIEVADTGIGIAPEDLPKALEPFGQVENAITRTYEGTGLGLPLAKNLVELHGGSFEIASEVGRGTAVRITFPFGSATPPRLTPAAVRPKARNVA